MVSFQSARGELNPCPHSTRRGFLKSQGPALPDSAVRTVGAARPHVVGVTF